MKPRASEKFPADFYPDGMSDAERFGYDYAIAQLEHWAADIRRQAEQMPPIKVDGTLSTQMRNSAGLAEELARAMRTGNAPSLKSFEKSCRSALID